MKRAGVTDRCKAKVAEKLMPEILTPDERLLVRYYRKLTVSEKNFMKRAIVGMTLKNRP